MNANDILAIIEKFFQAILTVLKALGINIPEDETEAPSEAAGE